MSAESHYDIIDEVLGLDDIGDDDWLLSWIETAKEDEFWEFLARVEQSLPEPSKTKSSFKLFGGSELSGLGLECAEYECRSESVLNAASFAAFFSDELVLYNPISRIVDTEEHHFKLHVVEPFSDLQFHLRELIYLTPLIRRKMITFVEFSSKQLCNSCFRNYLEHTSKFKNAGVYFSSLEYMLKITQIMRGSGAAGRHFRLQFDRPFSHGHSEMYIYNDSFDRQRSWKDGSILTKKKVLELRLLDRYAEMMSNDIVNKQLVMSSNDMTSAISNPTQIDVLQEIFGRPNIANKFDFQLPLLASRNLDSMLRLREAEWHHFEDFRNFIFAFNGSASEMSFAIKNEIAKLETVFRKAKTSSKTKLFDKAAISLATMAAYSVSGDVSAAVTAAVAAIGAGHFAKSLVPELRKVASEPEVMRDSQLYLAWKFNRLLKD